jgi:hypothetical protein
MWFQGYISDKHTRSFTEYGAKDLYTDERGILCLWLPSTAPSVFVATITMEDGSVHYFVFRIEDDGTVVQTDYLVVNGQFVTDRADASGTGWTYTKDTCLVTLTGDATVEGVSTNGAHRLFVNRGGAPGAQREIRLGCRRLQRLHVFARARPHKPGRHDRTVRRRH